MRITYIHQYFSFPTETGGQRPWQFSRRLAAKGHDVTVLCSGAVARDTVIEGVRIKRLEVPYDNGMSTNQRIASFLKFMVKATLESSALRSDLIFASSTPLTTAIPGMVGALMNRAPFVFEVRDLWPSVPVELGVLKNPVVIAGAKALEKLTYSVSKHVIALSPGMAEGVRKVSASTPVTVIPNASDFDMFESARKRRAEIREELGWGSDETVLLYAGSFGTSYDVRWLVDVAGALQGKQRKYRVVIIGREGTESDNLRDRAQELDLDKNTLLPGPQPKTVIADLLPAADFAVSTMIDAKPLEVNSLNKVFDALAAATPVVFNHHGWLPSLLTENGAGVQLPRDPDAAADRLDELLSSGYDRQTASAAALTLGLGHFARDDLFERFYDVLLRAASSKDQKSNSTSKLKQA